MDVSVSENKTHSIKYDGTTITRVVLVNFKLLHRYHHHHHHHLQRLILLRCSGIKYESTIEPLAARILCFSSTAFGLTFARF
jgi:hypothetical protein